MLSFQAILKVPSEQCKVKSRPGTDIFALLKYAMFHALLWSSRATILDMERKSPILGFGVNDILDEEVVPGLIGLLTRLSKSAFYHSLGYTPITFKGFRKTLYICFHIWSTCR